MIQFILGVIVGAVIVLIWNRRATNGGNTKRSLSSIGSLSDNPELIPVITMIVDQRIDTKLRELAEYRSRSNNHQQTAIEILAKALE